MRKEYNKLVRERIPEIIQQNGLEYQVVTLTKSEYVD
jgi:predicted house-cleaning noncanonical NTP pyrophosphatase (MazG superfamily)